MARIPRLRFAVATACLGMIALHFIVFLLVRRQVIAGMPDFRIFYSAALMLKRGEGKVLYDDRVQRTVQAEVAPIAVAVNGPLPYNHPPFEAAAFVPLTYLRPLPAYSLWFLLNLLLLGASDWVLARWLPTLRLTLSIVWPLLPLAFFPVAYALMQGQDSIALLFLYCLAYGAFRQGQDLRAGMFLGLGLFKFHLVVPFVFVLLVRRRWRAIGGFLISSGFDAAVSWILVGWKEMMEYPRYALQVNRLQPFRVIVPRNMPNLRGLLTGWSDNPPPQWLNGVLFVVSMCLLFWASRQWRPGDREQRSWNVGFSIALISTFLVGYHGYNQDMSILLLPTLVTLEGLLQTSQESGMGIRIAVGLMFFSPLFLVLTLSYSHQNLFALVLLGLLFCLSRSVGANTPSSIGRTRLSTYAC